VDSERIPTGDVESTPGWCWHGHGHDGDQPAYWFDGLDIPLTQSLEFYEEHPNKYQPVARVIASSPFRSSRDRIARELDAAVPDPAGFRGSRIALAAPSMPTIGLHMERSRGGLATRRHRSTANTVFVILEGRGISTIGVHKFAWRRGDAFVAQPGPRGT
jgi:gentisate 1,2-dioxygenase